MKKNKVLLFSIIAVIVIAVITLIALFIPKANKTETQVPEETKYTLSENMLFETNIEEMIDQCEISMVEPNGGGEDMYVKGNFGASEVEGNYVYMVRGGKVAKTYFYSTCSFTTYFEEHYDDAIASDEEPNLEELANMEKDNLPNLYKMAEGIYNECTQNYGITNFTLAIRYITNLDDTILPNVYSLEEFNDALQPLIDGDATQAILTGFTEDGHCYRITISNAYAFLAFNIEAIM